MDRRNLEAKMEENHEHADLDTFWSRQSKMWDVIEDVGGFEAYVQSLPNLQEAFKAQNRLICIDEGTEDGLHAAGSGVAYVITAGFNDNLAGYDAINAGVDAATEAFKDADLGGGVYCHEKCGAAKLVYDAFSDEFKSLLEKDHKITNSDEFGEYVAKELSIKLNINHNGMIGIGELTRPSESHVTRITYIDGTGKLDPAAIEGLPQGFVISRGYLGAEQTGVEASVSADIATGDHGFGDRITKENPHVFVAVGDSKDATRKLMEELQPIEAKYNGKVIIDGFTAPMYKG